MKVTTETVRDVMSEHPNLAPEKVAFLLAERYPQFSYEEFLDIARRVHASRIEQAVPDTIKP